MKIAYRVQHAAGRDAPLDRLLAVVGAAEVITDHEAATDPNPLRNYRRCLSFTGNATHLVVLQDDAVACPDLVERVPALVAERPDEVISLFVGGLPSGTRRMFLKALRDGERWSPIYFRDIHHVVALVWPVALANEFLSFIDTERLPGGQVPRSDDAAVGYWARIRKHTFWATVPCLVEHPDDVPSTIRRRERPNDAGRRAIAFIGDLDSDLPRR